MKSALGTLLSFVSIIALTLLVLMFDDGAVGQIREFLHTGQFPGFSACVHLGSYIIASYAVTKIIHKFRREMIFLAFVVSCFLAALWLNLLGR